MKTVSLLLVTETGDELGRLPLPGVVVAAAGETGGATRAPLAEEMTDVYRQIGDALTREGMEVTLDSIDVRVAVSRALLAEGVSDVVLIPLPVRAASGVPGGPTLTADKDPDGAALDLDDLFRLDESAGEEPGDA